MRNLITSAVVGVALVVAPIASAHEMQRYGDATDITTNAWGIRELIIKNNYEEDTEFYFEVLNRELEPLVEFVDYKTDVPSLILAPQEVGYFKVRLKEKGKAYVCSYQKRKDGQLGIVSRICNRLWYR